MSKLTKNAEKVSRSLDKQLKKGQLSRREYDRQKFGVIVYTESERNKR